VSVALLAFGTAALAQSVSGANPTYAAASVGSADYGTGVKLLLGGRVTPVFGYELQLTSLGSENYGPFNAYSRSAWALGGSGTARYPLNTNAFVFGKAGIHYLQPRVSGPGASDPDSSLELGVGAGLLWYFTHTVGARFEVENIGGSGGTLVSVGLQINF
jgi:hypothetical protein